MKAQIETIQKHVEKQKQRFEQEHFWDRFLSHDPTLWTSDSSQHAEIRNRLGWFSLLPKMKEHLSELKAFGKDVAAEGFKHVVLLGMGGSSLCPDVLQTTFGSSESHPTLIVLDSTDPEKILEVQEILSLEKTLFIVASKSGGTIEVQSLFRHFFNLLPKGQNFVAITDSGTVLEKQAQEHEFRKTFINPSDIGGRYSALSLFGLVPAAAIGMDLDRWLDSAIQYANNPQTAIDLGIILGEAAKAGKDKLTLLLSPELSSLGAWIEQLVAESTGKDGKGIVPIDLEPLDPGTHFSDDRVFCKISLANAPHGELDETAQRIEAQRHPILKRELKDIYDLSGEFFHWELATAVAGFVLEINPFDQPNVQESKTLTGEILKEFEEGKDLSSETEVTDHELTAFFKNVGEGDYIGLLAYLPQNERTFRHLQDLRNMLLDHFECATTLGFGPRFLHSTGQLHKGGKKNGVFLQITADKENDLSIPEVRYSFGKLQQAQAEGDLRALKKHGRRALRIHLSNSSSEELQSLKRRIEKSLK